MPELDFVLAVPPKLPHIISMFPAALNEERGNHNDIAKRRSVFAVSPCWSGFPFLFLPWADRSHQLKRLYDSTLGNRSMVSCNGGIPCSE